MQPLSQQRVFQDNCPKCRTVFDISVEGSTAYAHPIGETVNVKLTRCDGCKRMIVTAFLPNNSRVHWMQSEENLDNAILLKDQRVLSFSPTVVSVIYLYTPLIADRKAVLAKVDSFVTENRAEIGEVVLVDWYNGYSAIPIPQTLIEKVHSVRVLPAPLYAGFEGMKFTSLFAEKVLKKFAFSQRKAIVYCVYPSFFDIFYPFRYMNERQEVYYMDKGIENSAWTDAEIEGLKKRWVDYTGTETLYVGVKP